MTDLDRKILAKACGVDLYYPNPLDIRHMILKHSFTTPDDWELVRMKVVREYTFEFTVYLIGLHYGTVDTVLRWWLTLPPEQCNQLAADFTKSHPDLFPWVVDFIAEIAEKKMPTGSTQIISGKGMPWEEKK